MTTALGWIAAVLLTAGVVVGWLALARADEVGTRIPRQRRRHVDATHWAAALFAGVVAIGLTRWPALGVGAVVAALVVPRVVRRRREDAAYAARLGATRDWLLQLRSLLVAGEGIEQALRSTASLHTPGGPLASALDRLMVTLPRVSTASALRRFGRELDNHVGDAAVLALVHALERGARDLSATLAALADWARDETSLIDRIEAERRGIRTSQTIILSVFAMMPLTFAATAPQQLAVYGTVAGQAVLSVMLAVAAGCVLAISSTLRPPRPGRSFAEESSS